MIERIKKSLAYRLPFIYKKVLRFKSFKTKAKPLDHTIVITMTGRAHIQLTRVSILSIANKWATLIKLVVYSDGSISDKEIRSNLKFWKGELIVALWLDVANYHEQLGRNALIEYAKKNPFGKKMGIILFHAEKDPVIWIDSDILFFNDFTPFIPKQNSNLLFGGSEDSIQAFDARVLKEMKSKFDVDYKFNAGLLYACGAKIYEQFNIENVLKKMHPDYDFLTEQTIFAHIANQSLKVIWPQHILKSSSEDNQNIIATGVKQIVARHYVSNIRHLFWRDAFFYFNDLNNPDY